MNDFLISLLYLARPLFSVELDLRIAGLSSFEYFSLVWIAVLILLALLSRNRRSFTGVEIWMLMFCLWCSVNYLFYIDVAVLKTFVKWLVPFATYIILRRALADREILMSNMRLMLIISVLPAAASAYLIFMGLSVSHEIYLTGFARYRGVYGATHELGHMMGLILILMVMNFVIPRVATSCNNTPQDLKRWKLFGMMLFFVVCAYNIYYSQVRTVIVGLGIYLFLSLFFYSRKGLAIFIMILFLSTLLYPSKYQEIFYDFTVAEEDVDKAGSGRLLMWKRNLTIFFSAPVEQQFLGLGVGNWYGSKTEGDRDSYFFANSHNDWLQTMMELGYVGLLLMIGIYLAILVAILNIDGREKYIFLSFWFAVVAMNMFSNSYISRTPISQMMLMILVYAELPNRKSSITVTTQAPPTELY